ncbi:MAG: flotillin-like FloA family protein, partial [Bacteroidota bacterium]
FREGNLGIMDYYKYKNIMADTQMRESIADSPEGSSKTGQEGPDTEK